MIDEARARTGNRYNLIPVFSELRLIKIIIPLIEFADTITRVKIFNISLAKSFNLIHINSDWG